MSRPKLTVAIIAAACAAAIVTQQIALRRSRAENADLRQQIATLREAPPPAAAAPDPAEVERLRVEREELVRLRGQVAQLRRERDELSRKLSSLSALTNKPVAAQSAPADEAWVQQMLNAPVAQQGAAVGALRGKMLRGDMQSITASERALLGALSQRDLNSLERTPKEFADFQTAFIQGVTGISDPAKAGQIHDLIRNTYEHAVANRLDIPSKPASETANWVNQRHQLDRRATSAIQGMLTPEEKSLFDRAFLGVMGIDRKSTRLNS